MKSTKPKNIVLCADGTGNRGGYTPDSNVYKLYNAVDLHHPDTKQVVFYDNGIGTQSNKYYRGIASAFGFGFKANVCDLYEYLARNYNPGDQIYMFGFSRGAATIRAFNGFVDACGLVDGREKGNKQLKKEVRQAMHAYSRPRRRKKILSEIDKIHFPPPKVKFIGVWDTVSALGFPEQRDVAGVGFRLLHFVARAVSSFYDMLDPFKFYNYELTPNIEKACQALAIDDERTTFWPKLWNENLEAAQPVEVKQVWFAGMHSNIGGSYKRAGLANVCFKWMLENIEGLFYKEDVLSTAKANSNAHGRLYNSREGFAIYYRYHPREIDTLCRTAGATVQIHKSVMDRMHRRTANYAPVFLPKEFNVVDDQAGSESSPPVHESHWSLFRKWIGRFVYFRKWSYGIFIELTFILLLYSGYLWMNEPKVSTVAISSIQKHLKDVLEYISPKFFDGLIQVAVINKPYHAIGILIFLLAFWLFREYARKRSVHYAECLRKLYINSPKGHPDY